MALGAPKPLVSVALITQSTKLQLYQLLAITRSLESCVISPMTSWYQRLVGANLRASRIELQKYDDLAKPLEVFQAEARLRAERRQELIDLRSDDDTILEIEAILQEEFSDLYEAEKNVLLEQKSAGQRIVTVDLVYYPADLDFVVEVSEPKNKHLWGHYVGWLETLRATDINITS